MTLTRPGRGPASIRATPRAPRAPAPRRRLGWDWLLAGSALALALIGALLVWSATRADELAAGGNPRAYLYRHLINVAIAVLLAAAASRIDARLLRLSGPVVYLASCVGLVAVLFVGTTVNGAHAWIQLTAGLQIQPAEFAKLGLIVGLAVWFGQRAAHRPPDRPPGWVDVLAALILSALPLALIMRQPDLGSAMVVASAAFGVLLAAGVRARWTVGLLVLGVLGALAAVRAGVLAQYQLARFTAFTDPHADVQGVAYNITQARIAIAHGGWFGQGLFHGAQTSAGIVPEQQTDFIFSAAGEELGFLGSALIILLLGLMLWRGLRIARAADHTGRLVAAGVVCWFGFQTFQNVGMNLGITPVTGLPLPFVSYGGSSMFAGALAVGLLQAIRRSALT